MNHITTIIPIHEINDIIISYLNKAIYSVKKQENAEIPHIIIVYSASIESEINVYEKTLRETYSNDATISFLKNENNSDYQSQVNFAVQSVTTDYFSVLEFDDEYGTQYIKNCNKYIESFSDVDIFLSMIIEVNDDDQGIKLTNETVWAQQFIGENGEMGYLNATSLKQYSDFKLSGAAIKKDVFINLGMYKSKIKLAFMYEFLLRALNNAAKIYTIPKIGYKHFATRDGSLFNYYLKNMPNNERKFWFETATKESNFMNDRDIDTSVYKKTTDNK